MAPAWQEEPEPVSAFPKGRGTVAKPLRIFPFGVSRNRLEQVILRLGVPATIVREQHDADLVMTLKSYFRQKPQPIHDAEARGTPVYVLRSNTATQMENVVLSIFPQTPPPPVSGGRTGSLRTREVADPVFDALAEAEDAISAIMGGAPAIELTPQAASVRRKQHELAERYNLASRSRGRDPRRFVEISRRGIQ